MMVFIITALYIEAKPLINKLDLKKDARIRQFQVFKNDNISLIITGTGPIKAGAGVSFILAKLSKNSEDVIINVGTAGTNKSEIKINQVFICNKIINNDSKRTFYPDIIYKHAFKEGCLQTFSIPIFFDKIQKTNIIGDFVDMEGAAVYEAASIFLQPHRIAIIKVISDNTMTQNITPNIIEKCINTSADNIISWIERTYFNNNQINKRIFNDEEIELLNCIKLQLKLTQSMETQLHKYAKYYKLNYNNIKEVLRKYTKINCQSKIEGKKYFELLKQTLLHA